MTTGIIHSEQNLEKQIEKHMGGCMAGFFSIFDRNHILSSSSHHKRLPSTLRPPVTPIDSASDYSVSCGGSPSSRSGEITTIKPPPPQPQSTTHLKSANIPPPRTLPPPPPKSPKSPPPPVEVLSAAKSTSPWKFTRDAPRLSLDSRAIVDAKGKLHPRQQIRTPPPPLPPTAAASNNSCDETDTQRRSPSVVARLMGLDNLPSGGGEGGGDCASTTGNRRVELRRSASESRSRDLLPLHCRLFIDTENGNSNGTFQQNVRSGRNVFNNSDDDNGGGCGVFDYPRVDDYNDNSGVGGGGYNAGDGESRFGWGTSPANPPPPPPPPAKHNHHHHNHQGARMTMTTPPPPPHHHHHHHYNTRKGFYDSGDFFPDPKPHSSTTSSAAVYSEVEKRLRMSGIDEPCRDLETLKQILEALKLKGLLHHHTSSKPTTTEQHEDQFRERRFATRVVGNGIGSFSYEENSSSLLSPIVLMKPARSPPALGRRFRSGDNMMMTPGRSAAGRSPVSSSSPVVWNNDKGLSLATRKRMNRMEQQQQHEEVRRSGCGSSPVPSPRMVVGGGGGRVVGGNGGSRRRRHGGGGGVVTEIVRGGGVRRGGGGCCEEDESSTTTVSDNTTSTETERSRVDDDYRDGKNLLARCDKLLHSIAEMNINNNNAAAAGTISELQPSPVSVLDSTFYKEDEEEYYSPSPPVMMKRRTALHFKDQLQSFDLDDESWSPSSIPEPPSGDTTNTSELKYISEILTAYTTATNHPHDPTHTNNIDNLFLTLEKKHHHHHHQSLKRINTSNSRLRRRLLFDATTEILDHHHHLPPWQSSSDLTPDTILSEIQRSSEEAPKKDDGSPLLDENMFEVVCRVMKRDLSGSIRGGGGWNGGGDHHQMEVSEAVLGIERLVFKDLIGEAIRDLGLLAAERNVGVVVGSVPRRRLVY